MNLPVYNQGDPRWASKPLGTSGRHMADSGCFVSACAVALSNYGHNVNPGQLCDALNPIGGFDPEGLLRWDKLEQLYPDVALAAAFDTTNQPTSGSHVLVDVALKRISNLVRLGIPVMITVDVPNAGIAGFPDHIITLTNAPEGGIGWLANDSDGGTVEMLAVNHKYPPPDKSIFGARVLVGAPTSFPDYSDDRDKRDAVALWKASQVMRGRNIQTYSKEIVDSYIL